MIKKRKIPFHRWYRWIDGQF